MSRSARRAMVRRNDPALSLSRQCSILSISRSSLYYRPKGESAESLALMRRIDELYLKYPFYGSRQMARQLGREGHPVGRHRVRRPIGRWACKRSISRPGPARRIPSIGFIPTASISDSVGIPKSVLI